jgi:hypothetical protein
LPVVNSTNGLDVLAIVQPKRKMQTHMIMARWIVSIAGLPIEASGYRGAEPIPAISRNFEI